MENTSDIAFFVVLTRHTTLAAAAQELGVTAPAVSRRLAAVEARLGVRLINRTTRRQSLTVEGERYLDVGRRILGEIAELEGELAATREEPRGLLRVNAGFGFGRRHLGPVISEFAQLYPKVDVILQLTDKPMDIAGGGVDICVRLGLGHETSHLTRKIASNRRFLCASPAYLSAHARPTAPQELTKHICIVIREYFGAYNTWQLETGREQLSVKVSGRLSTNHGEIAVDWALAGHGILLRSQWDIDAYLKAGELIRILPDWSGIDADIYAVYPHSHQLSAKVQAFNAFLYERFANRRGLDSSW